MISSLRTSVAGSHPSQRLSTVATAYPSAQDLARTAPGEAPGRRTSMRDSPLWSETGPSVRHAGGRTPTLPVGRTNHDPPVGAYPPTVVPAGVPAAARHRPTGRDMPTSTKRSTLLVLLVLLGGPAGVRAQTHPVARAVGPVTTVPDTVIAPDRVVPRRATRSRRDPGVAPRPARDKAGPSGRAMPTGDLPGWHQVMAQDFTGSALPAGWGPYAGTPGGNRYGWWSPEQVTVGAGTLALRGSWVDGRYATGGVMAWGSRSTYGKYAVRFKAPVGSGLKYALLLWPSNGGWPATGEIDFAEAGDGSRQVTTATLHHGAANHQEQHTVKADFSRWQTVGVEWSPGRVVYTLGDRPWASVASSAVPSGPMDLALQLEAGAGDHWSAAPDRATPAKVALEVDWAVAYRAR